MALPQTTFAPITLAECLRIEPFAAARVVAGTAGLGRPVRWVHPVDVPNIEECLVGGELIMTSGISLGHDLGLQRRIVPVMAHMDLSGLVVAVGPYLDRVPPIILDAADEHAIPVLELPWEVNFRDVTEAILTAIVDRQHAMLQLSAEVHRSLTQLVLEGGDLHDLTDRLTALLGRSALVLDPAFHLLAGTPGEDAGVLVRSTLETGRAPAAAVERVRRLTPERIPIGGHPRVFAEPDLDGMLTPIVAERRAHGHLWIDGAGRSFGALDVIAAEHGATIAALVTYKDDAVRRAERRQERDLLDLLLDGAVAGDDPRFEAARMLPAEGDYVVLVVELTKHDPVLAEKVAERVLAEFALNARAHWRSRALTVVLPARQGDEAAARLQEALVEGGHPPRVGVSEPVAGLRGVAAAHLAAREALRLVPLVDGGRSVCRAAEIRTLRRLVGAAVGGSDSARVARLVAYDADQGARLLETLDRYLQHDGNVSAAARTLGIHRHTLLNRLERIAEVLEMKLTPAARLELRLQIVLYHLGQASEPV